MRVGQILTSVRDGGLEKTVLLVSAGLQDSGHEVSAYALLQENTGEAAFREKGIPFQSFHARNRGLTGAVSTAATILQLSKQLRHDKLDIVVVHDFYSAMAGRIAARLAGVPCEVAVLHSTYEWLGSPARTFDRMLARKTDAFVAVSDVAREARLAWGGYDPERIHVIHNGADASRFGPDSLARKRIRAEFGIPSEALLVGSVGVVRESKRQTDLVTVLGPEMCSRNDIHLLLVGSARAHEDSYARELDQALAHLPSERVHQTGNRSDVPALLAAMDLYVAPSESEGFGLALVEALMTDLPVIASEIPAHLEVAKGNAAVAFYPSRDIPRLAEALRAFLGQPASNRRSGREEVVEHFSEQRMITKWNDLLLSLAKRT